MIKLSNALLLASLALAPGPRLAAGDGTFGASLGAAMPTGGARRWLGTTTGVTMDLMQSFSIRGDDTLRVRFGFLYLKAPEAMSQTVAFPATPAAAYPYSSTNELFGFTYGLDYLRAFPGRSWYALGGLGFAYLTASTKGNLDLTAQGSGVVRAQYDANSLSPYLTLGMGVKLVPHLALETRYQYSSVRGQQRGLKVQGGGPVGGTARFNRVDMGTLTFALVGSF
jgi:hypothetical protein